MLKNKLKELFLSKLLVNATKTQRIAYIGVLTALLVVCNMFFEIKFADIQFSLTIFFSVFAGVLIGPLFGFVASFLGDLVGFLYNSAGFMYMPWIGIAMGCASFIAGIIVNGFDFKIKGSIYIKLLLVSILTFLLCTIAINTTAFWILYSKGVSYFDYLIARLIGKGQIWNSLVNYALLFIAVPLIERIKYFKVKF